MQPSRYRHLVARGLARALLAGAPERDGMRARAAQAIGSECTALPALVDELLPMSLATWQGLTAQALADRLVASESFPSLMNERDAPYVRRWILRPSAMVRPPLGLDGLALPRLDHSADLASWLGLSVDELDWFTYCAARRRRAPLHAQHYGFAWRAKPTGGGGGSSRHPGGG